MSIDTSQLESTLAGTQAIIAAINPDDLGASTPCEGWNAQQVIDHLIEGLDRYAEALGAPKSDPGEADHVTSFWSLAERLIAAIKTQDPQATVRLPMGPVPIPVALGLMNTELLVHGWDLATATNHQVVWDEAAVESAIALSQRMIPNLPPERKPFADPVEVPKDSPAIERLVGLLGRSPIQH